MKPTLYHAAQSTCSQKVRLALAEKSVDFDSTELNLIAGDQHRADYRALNPNGVVPTLVNGDDVVIESTIINEYIDDAFAGTPLRPAGASDRARMRLWTKRLDDTVHPQIVVMSFCVAFRMNFVGAPPEKLDAFVSGFSDPRKEANMRAMVEQGVEAPAFAHSVAFYDTLIADMESTLSRREWLAGDDYSLADIGYAPYLTRLSHLGLGDWWSDKPAVKGWFERLRVRPAYVTAVDQWMPGPLLEMMAAEGAKAWPVVQNVLKS